MPKRRDRPPTGSSWLGRLFRRGAGRRTMLPRRAGSRGNADKNGAGQAGPCKSCGRRINTAIPRCPHCGTRNQVPIPETHGHPHEDLHAEIAAQLSELQKQILIASLEEVADDPAIHVMRVIGPGEGEIKAGSQRLYGNEAVEAVEALLSTGFVARRHESGFELTAEGRRIATTL